ncbi:MAG: diaminopimelate decarboxylase [Candidatus Magasanikbacteria bacterium]|nr:diaminopimelate decarboxylase [Candidatus Magasanikbacteria bacterium]
MPDFDVIDTHIVENIAERFGTPVYVYDLNLIRRRIKDLQSYMGLYPKTEFLYAVKANYNPRILKEIISLGCGVDAVSPEEVKLGLVSACPKERLMCTENNMTDFEMHEVQKSGVLLNIGSLSRLEKYGRAYPGSKVCVRFNPNVGSASHDSNITGGPDSKFGISFKDVSGVLEMTRYYGLQVIGVHQHIGSGWLALEEPLLALDVILDIAAQFPDLEFVDVGGGFGVPYKPGQKSLDLQTLGMSVDKRFKSFCALYGRDLTLRFEPGRYIVAQAGSLITRVNTIKQSISGKIIVGTDTGMNQLVRVAMYGSYHPIRNLSNALGMVHEYDITGNICECADFFAKDREMPEIREGDLLSIDIAGAYGMSMASNYQFRGLPAEVLVDRDKVELIRRRQTFEDVFSAYN